MFKYLGIESDFLESENIISKLNLLQKIERLDPYHTSYTLQQRIQNSLECLPYRFRKYALALFANTIYLPNSFSNSILEHMLNILTFKYRITRDKLGDNCLILEQDPTGIINDFLRTNHVDGRLDKRRFQRTQQVKAFVTTSVINKNHPELSNPEKADSKDPFDRLIIEDVRAFLNKKYWVILIDNALSGTSLYSDINLLLLSREYHHATPEKVILLIRTLAKQAEEVIKDKFKEQLSNGSLEYHCGLYLDDHFVIRDGNEKCSLFQLQDTYENVRGLCRWFSDQEFFREDKRIFDHAKNSADNSAVVGFDQIYYRDDDTRKEMPLGKLAFGFKGVGLTYVSSENCPSDSIPLLWFDKPGTYVSPFPRVLSRLGDKDANNQCVVELV